MYLVGHNDHDNIGGDGGGARGEDVMMVLMVETMNTA